MSAILQCVSSGSIGNSYILDCNGGKLLIECGVRRTDLLRGLNYDFNGVSDCISTHKHRDHVNPQTLKYLLSCGIKVYAPQSVCEKYPKCKQVEHLHKYQVGGFTILPLKVPHGDCECLSYHITMPDGQTLLFATDLERLPYKLPNLTHIVLECNFSNELILDSLVNGDILRSQSQNHLELEECIATVKRLRHGGLQSVILVHLSNGLSDENMFKERFRSELGITPLIAESGKNFSLESCEF